MQKDFNRLKVELIDIYTDAPKQRMGAIEERLSKFWNTKPNMDDINQLSDIERECLYEIDKMGLAMCQAFLSEWRG